MGKKIAVIGLPGKWSTEVLADALAARTGYRMVIDMAHVSADVTRGCLFYQGEAIDDLDGIVVKKITDVYSPNTLDRLELLRIAEAAGTRVFSRAENIIRLVNRLSCTVSLGIAGVPMPETVITEDIDTTVATVLRFGGAVLKPLYSTKARGMVLLDAAVSEDRLRADVEAFRSENPVMYIQKKLDLSGQDLGMVFLGGEYLGTYARVSSDNAWNTTIHSGGKYAAYEPEADVIEMARKAQGHFGMDFTTVDVALTEQGPIVFEVSAFGGFRGAKEGIKMDAADLYADYVVKALS